MRAILIGAGLALGLAACEPAGDTEPAADPMPAGPVDDAWVARLPAALEGVSAPRALVVAEPDGGVRVIPLAG